MTIWPAPLGGTALARRLAGNHRDTDSERRTADLAAEVEPYRAALLQIMRDVGEL
jgi:hypothetical protein